MISANMTYKLNNFNKRLTFIRNISPFVTNVAQRTLGHILRNVAKGKAGDGTPLKKYTAKYAERKREGWKPTASRRGYKGSLSTVPNLTVSTDMLESLHVESGGKYKATIQPQEGQMDKFKGNVYKRPILGIDKGNLNKIIRQSLTDCGIGD